MSAPVTWDKLPDVEINDFTIATMPARFAALGDLHEGIDDAVPTSQSRRASPCASSQAGPGSARQGAEADASAEQPQDLS